ncbi:MAG: efflux RND transporter permease subunit [Candidatus Obscuribacterales bacterium]|nr:efflux RND transporter permease subunit [Candidatus Obscuribacterales bacterium]
MKNFARFFIHRPAFATVISLLILIAGALSIKALPIAQYPDITPPTVQVETSYQGASAATVEECVAVPIEQEVNGTENMIYMSSYSSSDGRYVLTCTFKVGTDLKLAAVDVQNRVSKAQAKLPAEVLASGLSVTKQSPNMLMVISLYSPDKVYDDLFLSNYARLHISDTLSRIPGVGNLSLVGEREYSMRIWLRPDKLAELGLTADELRKAIQDQNIQAPAGSVGQAPIKENVNFQYTVNVKGRLSEPEEYEKIILRSNANGSLLRLKDLARTELGAKDYKSFGRINRVPSTIICIYQLPGANALQVAEGLRQSMKTLSRDFPAGIKYEISLDNTLFVTSSIEEVLHTLAEAILLVLLVVFIFLGNFRATLIPMLAVPVSLIGTFAAFIPLGFSINLLTLFALVLAIGLVVDDAIVVVEAVEAKIEEGKSPLEASELAMEEVSGPVLAIALVLCAVFVPVAFMGGITGQLYKQFAITLAISVLISALVALTLTPALCKMLLKHKSKASKNPLSLFLEFFNKCFAFITELYLRILRQALDFWPLALLALAGLTAAAICLGQILPTGFVPDEDQGYFISLFTLPDGASLERTDALTQKAEKYLKSLKGVKSVITMGGFNTLTNSYNSNSSTIFTVLEPWEMRESKELSAESLIEKSRKEFEHYPEASSVSFGAPPIPGLGSAGGFQFELEDRSGTKSAQELSKIAQQLIEEGKKSPKLLDLYTAFSADVPQIKLDLDRDKALSLGAPVSSIFNSLQTYMGGLQVNDFNKFGRTYKVILQAEAPYRLTADSIKSIYVRGAGDKMLPLSTLSTISSSSGPSLLQRYNLFRTAEISGAAAAPYSSGQAIAAMEKLSKSLLGNGFAYEWTGTAYQEKESASSQLLIFALALIFVFLFLVAQYESWTIPISVLLAIPLGVFGAFSFLSARSLSNDAYAQIGLVMLIGLSAKNAILIVEFAKEKRAQGLSLKEAALQAAQLRFRPILMTSFAFILGVYPLVVASGAGAAARHSLGSTVFGGMLAATIMGVVFIPVLYFVVENASEFFSRILTKSRSSITEKAETENFGKSGTGKSQTEADSARGAEE